MRPSPRRHDDADRSASGRDNQTISDPSADLHVDVFQRAAAKITATSANTATITGVAAGQSDITAAATSGGITKTSADFV